MGALTLQFFSVVNVTVLHDRQLIESTDVVPISEGNRYSKG